MIKVWISKHPVWWALMWLFLGVIIGCVIIYYFGIKFVGGGGVWPSSDSVPTVGKPMP